MMGIGIGLPSSASGSCRECCGLAVWIVFAGLSLEFSGLGLGVGVIGFRN